jgi:molybdenum cofactor cytidylyltransferase
LDLGESPELVAIVGGGGKTSLMFALAAELPGRAVLTTTTRIFAAQMKRAPAIAYAEDLSALPTALDEHGRCLVVGRVEGEKALGVDPALPARLLARPDVDWVLVEADGSRMRPVKAPADHEPVVPPGTTLLVPVAGIDALAGPLEEVAHRPERVRELLGQRATDDGRPADNQRPTTDDRRPTLEGNRLTPRGLAHLLTHPMGGLKAAPDGARIVPFINKVETGEQLPAAREAAALMLAEPRVSRVVIGALHSPEPVREVWRRVAAAVLAAGESRRMGHNKLLLPWGDTTVLGRTLGNVRASAVHNLVLVTGFERERVEAVVTGEEVPSTYNLDYAKGMLASVQTAVRALPSFIEAMLVVLGDQPMVEAPIIDELLRAYAAGPQGLVAPTYRGARGNPVLIDRRYFAELLALPLDAAPRALLERHADDLRLVEVDSEAILIDLDRPEEYVRWREGERYADDAEGADKVD